MHAPLKHSYQGVHCFLVLTGNLNPSDFLLMLFTTEAIPIPSNMSEGKGGLRKYAQRKEETSTMNKGGREEGR